MYQDLTFLGPENQVVHGTGPAPLGCLPAAMKRTKSWRLQAAALFPAIFALDEDCLLQREEVLHRELGMFPVVFLLWSSSLTP